jgi:peptidoglycan-associated lipoprotein
MKPVSLVLSASCVVLAVACGGAETKPAVAPTATAAPDATAAKPPPPPPQANVDNDPTRGQLNIDEAIRKACGITDAEAYFAYDSANVRPEYRKVLKKLAVCFTTGPLAGRVMRLVGHADARGEDSYNLALGGQRADNVKKIIVAEGMTESKTDTSSRGEMDSDQTTKDEAVWAKDRRVDVLLGQ